MDRKAQISFSRVLVADHDMTPDSKGDETMTRPRRASWHRDEWHYVGVIARAEIKIPYGNLNPDCWITARMDSPGLWGVESDSGEKYFAEVYREELATLRDMLESLRTYEIVGET